MYPQNTSYNNNWPQTLGATALRQLSALSQPKKNPVKDEKDQTQNLINTLQNVWQNLANYVPSSTSSTGTTWKVRSFVLPAQYSAIGYAPTDTEVSLTNWTEPSFPADQAIWTPIPNKFENLNSYRSRTGEALPTRTDEKWYTPETANTRIAKMPDFLGWGEYLTDPNSANVANTRDFVPAETQAILWSRDPRLYQVDHIVPLWAWGADTLANKQILTLPEHQDKSKIQSVPFTLMANGDISPQEAKTMAMNWKSYDPDWIPKSWESGGLIDHNIALQKYNEWKNTKPVTIKDWLNEIPTALKWATNFLQTKTGENSAEQLMKSMAGWFISEASMGILPYEPQSTDTSSQVWSFIGKIAGWIASFASVDWLVWQAARGLSLIKDAKMLKSLKNWVDIAEDTWKLADAWSSVLPWILTREWISATAGSWITEKWIPVVLNWLSKWAQKAITQSWTMASVMKNIKLSSALKSAWLMTAYWQIRMTAPAVFWENSKYPMNSAKAYFWQYPSFWQHVTQALQDLAYWGMMGTMPRGVKWAAWVWASTWVLSTLCWETPQQATLDAATMMAIHSLGWANIGKDWKNLPSLKDTTAQIADSQAKDHLNAQLWASNIKKAWIDLDHLNKDSIAALQEMSDKKVNEVTASNIGKVDLPEISKQKTLNNVAIRQLSKHDMSIPELERANNEDLSSIWDKLNNKEQVQEPSIPDEVVQTAVNWENTLFNWEHLPITPNWQVIWSQQPVGEFPVTGISSKIDWGFPRQRVDYYFDARDKGNASNTLLLVERSELEDMFKGINNDKKILNAKALENNEDTVSQHPENSVQAYGIVRVADPKISPLKWVARVKNATGGGSLDIVPLWWIARKSRIATVDKWWRVNSFNQNWINSWYWEDRLLDENNNKDTLATGIRSNQMKVLTADLSDKSMARTPTSGQPFILANIKPENWNDSIELNKGRIQNTLGDNVQTLAKKAETTKDPQAITNIIRTVKEKNPDLTPSKMTSKIAEAKNDPDAWFVSDVLNTFGEWLKSGSPDKMVQIVNNKYWEVIDKATASDLINNADQFTVQNAFDILKDWINSWKANKGTEILYRNNIIPFFKKLAVTPVSVDGVPVNSSYIKMPVLSSEEISAIKPEKWSVNAETTTPTKNWEIKDFRPLVQEQYKQFIARKWLQPSNVTKVERTPEEQENLKSYEKYNTFNSKQKQQEFENAKKEGQETINDWEANESDDPETIALNMRGAVWLISDKYKWNATEKQQFRDLMGSYIDAKMRQNTAPEFLPENKIPPDPSDNHFDDEPIWTNWEDDNVLNYEPTRSTQFKSIYPDIYSTQWRESKIWSKIAWAMNVWELTKRSWRVNNNSLANELQSSINTSNAEWKEKTWLLWKNVLSEFDKLGRNLDWRNRELDLNKFNQESKWLSQDVIIWGPKAGKSKTVDPTISNYEMDINIGRTDNLPKELQDKYHELQKEWYWHVYSSPSMNTNAFKGKTPEDSSYNMFKFVKDYVSKWVDDSLVKELYPDSPENQEKATKILQEWRKWNSLTIDNLHDIESKNDPENKLWLADKIEDKRQSQNAWLSEDLIQEWLSPVSEEDLKEAPEFNTPLSHALMSLSRYDINSLSDSEIKKLAKSVSYTLWPSIKKSLVTWEWKNDWKWGPDDWSDWFDQEWNNSLISRITQTAKTFSDNVNRLNPQIKTTTPTISPKIQKNTTVPQPYYSTPQTKNATSSISNLWKIVAEAESNSWANTQNKNSDAGKFWYIVWFTKPTYNWIVQKANQGDKRYQNLLKQIDLNSSPQAAINSAVNYINFRNNIFDANWNVVWKRYNNPEDMYLKLYNGTWSKAAQNNWRRATSTIISNIWK